MAFFMLVVFNSYILGLVILWIIGSYPPLDTYKVLTKTTTRRILIIVFAPIVLWAGIAFGLVYGFYFAGKELYNWIVKGDQCQT